MSTEIGTDDISTDHLSTGYLPDGYTSLTPFVVVSPASEAIDFYQEVFGARITSRMDGPDETVLHAELTLSVGRLQLMDPHEQYHAVANDPTSDESRFSVAIYVPDVDAVTELARTRGARIREEPADFAVTGDRFASIQDPFGVRWTIMTRVSKRTDEQIQSALDEWASRD